MVQYIMLLGDFWEPVVALWSTRSFELLCTVQISVPLHDASFCPFTANELTLIGSSAVVFTRIQTQDNSTELQVHTDTVWKKIKYAFTAAQKHISQNKLFLLLQVQKVSLPDAVGQAEVTSLCYSTRRILYTGTNSGHVCVWDCNTQCCFVTWEADGGEIGVFGFLLFWSHLGLWSQGNRITSWGFFCICVGVLVCRENKLVTGSNTKKLRLWSVASVQNLSNANNKSSRTQDDG